MANPSITNMSLMSSNSNSGSGGYTVDTGLSTNSTYGKTSNYVNYESKTNPVYASKFAEVEKEYAKLNANWYTEYNTVEKRNAKFAEITRKINIYSATRYLSIPKLSTYDIIKVQRLK
jgi:hypothetical protein